MNPIVGLFVTVVNLMNTLTLVILPHPDPYAKTSVSQTQKNKSLCSENQGTSGPHKSLLFTKNFQYVF